MVHFWSLSHICPMGQASPSEVFFGTGRCANGCDRIVLARRTWHQLWTTSHHVFLPLPKPDVEAVRVRSCDPSLHSLRRAFCTALDDAGKSATLINECTRDSSIETSMMYVRMSNGHLKSELGDVH